MRRPIQPYALDVHRSPVAPATLSRRRAAARARLRAVCTVATTAAVAALVWLAPTLETALTR